MVKETINAFIKFFSQINYHFRSFFRDIKNFDYYLYKNINSLVLHETFVVSQIYFPLLLTKKILYTRLG